jgi:hypothetical protein
MSSIDALGDSVVSSRSKSNLRFIGGPDADGSLPLLANYTPQTVLLA